MLESGRVSEKVESVPLQKNYLDEYRKMVDSGRVPGKGGIRAVIEKLSRRVLKKGQICERSEKWWNPGEYREKVESLRVSKNCPDEYWKRIESV